MPRPPLPIGGHGIIKPTDITQPGGPKKWRARCKYRGVDGKTKPYEANGPSKPAAIHNLITKLATMSASTTGDITGDTRAHVAAEAWYLTIQTAVEDGLRSPSTAAQYRGLLDRYVLPAIGDLRLRECTTGRLDVVLLAIKAKAGSPTAKAARTVLSGILGHAVRQDAITINTTRNTTAIPVKPRKQPRALTVEECARWLQRLTGDPAARRHDLVDLTGFMLGTGVRIGECLALQWEDVDLIGTEMVVDGAVRLVCTARVDWTLIRVTGKGLIRKSVKTSAGERTLRLPEFLVAMLRRRAFELSVLQTGYVPAGPEALGQFCGGSGQFCGCANLRKNPPRSDRVRNPSTQVTALPAGPGKPAGQSVAPDSVDIEDSADAFPCPCLTTEATQSLAGTPVFPDTRGSWRDPSNTRRDIRDARGEEFAWVTSHVYRKTAATMLDEAGLTARQIANQLGHARPSLTQDVYMGRGVSDPLVARALEQGLGRVFGMSKGRATGTDEGRHLA